MKFSAVKLVCEDMKFNRYLLPYTTTLQISCTFLVLVIWVGVRMTQRQNDTVRHFGTEGHFSTATK